MSVIPSPATRQATSFMSAKCHKPTSLDFELFDDLIGGTDKGRRHIQAERLGGFQVDDEMEFGRLLHRQVGRPLALQDAIDITGGKAKGFDPIDPVADQPAVFGKRYFAV